MRKIFLFGLICAGFANAQALSVGILGGAPFTDVVRNSTVSGIQSVAKSTNFTVGGEVQVALPLKFRIEVDALFRPYHVTLIGLNLVSDISAQQYRFPVLLQYRLGGAGPVKPFVEGGLSFDRLSGVSSAIGSAIKSGPGTLLHQSGANVVLGAGVDLKVPLVRVSGELRYIRQTASNFSDFSNLNQAEVLVGVHF
jgi:hypothetical protein